MGVDGSAEGTRTDNTDGPVDDDQDLDTMLDDLFTMDQDIEESDALAAHSSDAPSTLRAQPSDLPHTRKAQSAGRGRTRDVFTYLRSLDARIRGWMPVSLSWMLV